MSVVGWVVAVLGLVGVVFGVLQMLKGKKMNAVPFRAPSQIAQLGPSAADAKGLVSTEGSVGQDGILTAPMSGRPCLAFEISVSRKWKKSERTENGTSTKTGSDDIFSDYRGGMFSVHDGVSTVYVDASAKPDASFEKVHSSAVNVGMLGLIPNVLSFGAFSMNTPLLTGEGETTAFEGVEKIIPPTASMYALGALSMGAHGAVVHTPKGIGTGKLILSSKGRSALAKATKRNMTLGYAIGGAMAVAGVVLGIFGPKPAPGADECSAILTADIVSCDSRISHASGKDLTWKVTTAGDYTISAAQPEGKRPLSMSLEVTALGGVSVAQEDGDFMRGKASLAHHFEPGTYTLNVRDRFGDTVSGGYGFHLDIARADAEPTSTTEVTSAVTPAPTATNDVEAAAEPEPVAPPKVAKKKKAKKK